MKIIKVKSCESCKFYIEDEFYYCGDRCALENDKYYDMSHNPYTGISEDCPLRKGDIITKWDNES